MKIATLTALGKGATDALLADLTDRLAQVGLRAVGVVKQMSHEAQFANGCDMVVKVLPDGPDIAITQPLGPGSDACRLDPAGLMAAVTAVETRGLQADVFILNKFGPQEAAGGGFRDAIAKAIDAGVPVLVGLGNGVETRAAFEEFTGGVAESLPADPQALLDWCGAG